jgi:hypothetical protein
MHVFAQKDYTAWSKVVLEGLMHEMGESKGVRFHTLNNVVGHSIVTYK